MGWELTEWQSSEGSDGGTECSWRPQIGVGPQGSPLASVLFNSIQPGPGGRALPVEDTARAFSRDEHREDCRRSGLDPLRLSGVQASPGTLPCHPCCVPSVQVVDAAGLFWEAGATCCGNTLSLQPAGTSSWGPQLLLPPGCCAEP